MRSQDSLIVVLNLMLTASVFAEREDTLMFQ